jgi:hypothetical protein
VQVFNYVVMPIQHYLCASAFSLFCKYLQLNNIIATAKQLG